MQFTCNRDALAAALSKARRGVTPNAPQTAMRGIRLSGDGDTLQITGASNDLTIITSVKVEKLTPGTLTVPVLFLNVIQAMPGETVGVKLSKKGESVVISSGDTKTELRVIVDEYPNLTTQLDKVVQVDARKFRAAFGQVIPAASTDTNRPGLNSVNFTSETKDGKPVLSIAATDSYRLAVVGIEVGTDMGFDTPANFPTPALVAAQAALDNVDSLSVGVSEHELSFSDGVTTVIGRLINAQYPDYEKLIHKASDDAAEINREKLTAALKLARIVIGNDISNPIVLEVKDGVLDVESINPEVGNTTYPRVDAVPGAKDFRRAFNPAYLLDALSAFSGPSVRFTTLDNPSAPVLITGAADVDAGLRYVVMPNQQPNASRATSTKTAEVATEAAA